MEYIEPPPLQMVMHIPLFMPDDVYYVETHLSFEAVIDMIFLYCESHVTGSYSFYDRMSALQIEYEWEMDTELNMLDAISRMGKVLFYHLAINPVLLPLMVAEIVEVIPIANNSWLVKYLATDIYETAQTYGLTTHEGNTTTFNPANVNYPHAISGGWVYSVLS